MFFEQMFDDETGTYTYFLGDEKSRDAVLIDPVVEHVEGYLDRLTSEGWTLKYVLDTHVHADHVTGAGLLREQTGASNCLSDAAGVDCATLSLGHKQTLRFGDYEIEARKTPGHTNGCMTFVIPQEHIAFTGDALLIDGSGRTDFQQGDARTLYRSVTEQIFTLPDDTVLYPGHDYKGRKSTTVGHEKIHNERLGAGKSEDAFVTIMENLNLPYPKHIDRALPMNLSCGVPARDTIRNGRYRTATGIPEVTPAWVEAHRGRFRIVDVREPSEFRDELSHIDGAELVPLATLASQAANWDRDDHIVVVCRAGGRSGRGAAVLEQMGFEDVASMAGGMLAWRTNGLSTAA